INLMRDPLDLMEKFSGHCFRHTFATRCFEAGIQPKTVQTYLGHASLQMTMDLYTSVMEQKKTEDMKLLEDTIGLDKVDKISVARSNKIIQFA
ncbi:tyrosine-type recombinase/integrase, partial [Blautia sp.]|uniref:tyrosine-type recombinase/integrase n=1 Tax=Blautia sp. TaxID=1955243 RepID=UPI002A81AB24